MDRADTPCILLHSPRLGARVAHEVVCRACVHVAGHLGHQLGRRGGLLRGHQLGERLDDPRRRGRRGPSWPSTRQGRPSAPRVAIYPPWARGRLRAGALVAKGTFGRAGARRRRSRRPAAAPRGRAPGSTRRRPRRSAPSTRPPRGRESRGSGGPRGVRVRLRVQVRVRVRVRVSVRI